METKFSFDDHASNARFLEENDKEDELNWAAIQELPTSKQVKTSLFNDTRFVDGKELKEKRVVDVTKLGSVDRHVFVDKLLQKIEVDNYRLLQKLKERTNKVGLELPTVEVKYQNLCVQAECEVLDL